MQMVTVIIALTKVDVCHKLPLLSSPYHPKGPILLNDLMIRLRIDY